MRAVNPEARLVLDGEAISLGGLQGQPNRAFLLDAWLDELQPDPTAWILTDLQTSDAIQLRMDWTRVRHHAPDATWQPKDASLVMTFGPQPNTDAAARFAGVTATVHNELYDGIPLFAKWLEVHNGSRRSLEVDRVTVEELSIVEGTN